MRCFDGIQKSNFQPIKRTEVELRVRKLKNGKVAGKDEFTGEMVKGGLDLEAVQYGL